MIHFVKINGKQYPFKFGFRELFQITSSRGIEFDEAQQALSGDFDILLEMYAMASKKGARAQELDTGETCDLVLTAEELEFHMDDEPEVFSALDNAFAKSKVIKKMIEKGKEAEEGKGKSPAKSSRKK